jgi:hypothetical protein
MSMLDANLIRPSQAPYTASQGIWSNSKSGESKITHAGNQICWVYTRKEGIKFSEEKKSKVLAFALPLIFNSLKKLMGLAETFHRYIPNF